MKCHGLEEKSGLGGWGRGCGCVWGGLPWSGGAPALQKEKVVLCSGSPEAMKLRLPHLHLLLRNTIPLEIRELQVGGCAPPNPIPMGVACSTQQPQTSQWCFSKCPLMIETHPSGSTSCAPQPLRVQHQSLILLKHGVFSPEVWSVWWDST